ncbi:MAG: type III-B CRISPR module RAMP protein Cmr6 [Candidatus Methanomethylicaceae archaeon]
MSKKKQRQRLKKHTPPPTTTPSAAPSPCGRVPNYPLPKDVAKEVERAVAPPSYSLSNFGLLFHRFLRYPDEWAMEGEDKSRVWKDQVIRNGADRIVTSMSKALDGLHNRQAQLVKAFKQQHLAVLDSPIEMSVAWRLAIGFSAPSILDTGMALHRIYGIPYIPGSAVKGLTRHYCLSAIAEKLEVAPLDPEEIKRRRREKKPTPWEMLEELLVAEEPKDDKAKKSLQELFDRLKNDPLLDGPIKNGSCDLEKLRTSDEYMAQTFRRAFGSTSHRGEVIFFDAFPVKLRNNQNKPILELDIINTHYQEYYTGTPPKPPADYLSPKPVYFLTVRQGIPFRFWLAASDQDLLNDVRRWLQDALQQWGIGAKTMAGYGEMKP